MDTFGRNRAYDTVPILASGDYAKGFARHAMEISMFRECASPYDRRSCLGHAEHCFIMASDDLPVFGLILLLKNVNLDAQALSGLTLTVEIRHDMDVSVIQGEAVTENRNNVEDEAYNKSEAKFQEKATTGGIIPKNRLQSNTKPTDHQIRRLLEPLRRLHSLEAVYIEGPVTEKYKAPLIASMCGPEPSDQDLFDAVLAMFEDAEITDETGDLSSAITKMKDTLDTMKDYKETQARSYKSSPLWNAREEMQFNLETNLGWASLEKKTHADVRDAEDIVKTLLWSYIAGSYAHMAHDVAMVYYLWAIIWEALDAFGDHDSTCRSSSLKLLITFIQEGLRHEPGNMMLEQQLRRREVELQNETEVEDLMEMSDRIHERGDFAPRRE